MGAVLFRLLVAIAIRMGLEANDLKLITAVVVLAAIVAPGRLKDLAARRARKRGAHAAA
jgi:putative ABC transport system permease protein